MTGHRFTYDGEDLAAHAVPIDPDAARAADLDCAREAYRTFPIHDRPTFGEFAVNFLRERGLEVVPTPAVVMSPVPLTAAELRGYFPNLPESPFVHQALAMSVEDVADLLAALAERDLQWLSGENGECGTLLEGQPEPPDLHVAFDSFRAAWQRDDDRARDDGDQCARWFGPLGIRRTWNGLQRLLGPLTPDGGIAPTTPGLP